MMEFTRMFHALLEIHVNMIRHIQGLYKWQYNCNPFFNETHVKNGNIYNILQNSTKRPEVYVKCTHYYEKIYYV